MEITIDEAINVLEYLKTQNSQLLSLDVAIDTMQKYQKIQEIIKDWEDGRFSDAVGCLRVKAVIEDATN